MAILIGGARGWSLDATNTTGYIVVALLSVLLMIIDEDDDEEEGRPFLPL